MWVKEENGGKEKRKEATKFYKGEREKNVILLIKLVVDSYWWIWNKI